MPKFSAWLACIAGVILAVGVTAINWGAAELTASPLRLFFVMNYFTAALIFAAGLATLWGFANGPLMLVSGWYFTAGIGFAASTLSLGEMMSDTHQRASTMDLQAIGMLLPIAVIGATRAQKVLKPKK